MASIETFTSYGDKSVFDYLLSWVEYLKTSGEYIDGLEELILKIEAKLQDIDDTKLTSTISRYLSFWLEEAMTKNEVPQTYLDPMPVPLNPFSIARHWSHGGSLEFNKKQEAEFLLRKCNINLDSIVKEFKRCLKKKSGNLRKELDLVLQKLEINLSMLYQLEVNLTFPHKSEDRKEEFKTFSHNFETMTSKEKEIEAAIMDNILFEAITPKEIIKIMKNFLVSPNNCKDIQSKMMVSFELSKRRKGIEIIIT